MKQRILSIVMCFVLLLALPLTAGAEEAMATDPTVQIVSVLGGEDEVKVIFLFNNPQEGQKVTVLCEQVGSDPQTGEGLLYVGEWDNIAQGINVFTFPVDSTGTQGSYRVILGGSNVTHPSSFTFTFGAAAEQGGIAIGLNITCGQLLEQMGFTTDDGMAVIRVDDQPLGMEDIVPSGAVLTIQIDSMEITSLLYVAGDVNLDGAINAGDALLVLQHSVQLVTLDRIPSYAADVNFDSNINASDALLVLQYSVGIVDGF